MKVTVVVPVYNEAATVREVLSRVLSRPEPDELLVVDDASKDGTWAILQEIAQEHSRISLFRHEINRGKGAALRTGFQKASGDLVIIQDADFEYSPEEYPQLLDPLLKGKADVVYGSRFMGGQAHRVLYFWHSIGNWVLTMLSNMFTNLNLTDMETGAKAFRREMLDRVELKEERFGFEPEITAKLARLDARFYEVGVAYHGRTFAEGKKIGWKDGVRAIWCIFRYNLW
jgi:glycosyltransferase involved in cell wall biosynthesis